MAGYTRCNELDVTLIIVRRQQKGSMIDRWNERRQVLSKQQQAEQEAIAPCEESSSEKLLEIAPLKEGKKPSGATAQLVIASKK